MAEERRIVTVLFADVVGSTTMGESMDPEDLRGLLARFYQIASGVVEEHGGTLEKFIGDAAMAIFGLAQAHDDDASRALDAAMGLRERMRADPVLGERLPIRIGLNTGEVVATRDPARSDFLITGDAVNVAARLQQVAEPWQILASSRTASADLGVHEFAEPSELELKGKSAMVAARALVGRSPSRSRSRSPLVGREADLAQLQLVARRSFSERRPYMVSVIAPAGTGKSRLVEEFTGGLEELVPGARMAVAQCLPYGQRLTYWPMRALLFGIIGLDEDASPEASRRAIRDWLQDAGCEQTEETADLLAATIGALELDIGDRGALFNAWRLTLELAAEQRPLVLLIEDLHWSSDSLLDLIEHVLQPRSDSPMLILALARPELLERRPTWGGGRRNHVSLALEPLDDRSIGELVDTLLEGSAPELARVVIQRSEGNPFYAGEIVRSLVEKGVDLRDPAAVETAAGGLPDTVQATVLARLDALGPTARRTLQLGSVLGRSFSQAGIRAVEEPSQPIEPAIEQLIERELVRPSGRDELTFRHILIRDIAYGTLPRLERAQLHAAAGGWLEGIAAGREDELAELVAFHFREAATLGSSFGEVEDGIRSAAVRWLRKAGEVAAGARGMVEAAGHLRAAIDLAPAAEQPELYQRLAEFHGSGDQAVHAYARAWELGEEQGRPAAFVLRNLGRQLMVVCRWFASVARPVSEEEIQDLIAHGTALLPDADERARATFLIAAGSLPFWLRQSALRPLTDEDFRLAGERVREGLRLAEQLDDAGLISGALDAMTTGRVTDWQRILELSHRRTAMGDRLALNERLDALNMVAWASAALGDLEAAIGAAEKAVELVQPGQNMGFDLAGASWNAYARALRGEWDPLVAAVEDLRRRWLDSDRPPAAYSLQGFLSGVCWSRNRGDDQLLQRWQEVADDIIGRYDIGHPVAALAAVSHLDLDGVAGIVANHERYPDRVHYVEHALGLCADHRHSIASDVLEGVLARTAATGMRLMDAQARRLRGVVTDRHEDLAAALQTFEQIGAARYASRTRLELGKLTNDAVLMSAGRAELAALGEDGLPAMTSGDA